MISRLKILTTLLFFIFFTPNHIRAQETGWTIDQFHSEVTVNKDASITVTETITVDFNDLQKHGIYRTIPIKYKDLYGNSLSLRFTLNQVTDATGVPYQYKTSYPGSNIQIKIGDPDWVLSGQNTYQIAYTIYRAITFFDDNDEIYWNVTGNNWSIPITQTSANINLPGNIIDTICFTGLSGSSNQNCTIKKVGQTAQFSTTDFLNPSEGLTVVASFPKNLISYPTNYKKVTWFLQDNWGYVIPFFTLAILIYLYSINGRDNYYIHLFNDSKGQRPKSLFAPRIIPQVYYPPKHLTPSEAGTLIDERVDIADIAATLISLAVKGHLTIKPLKNNKDFQLKKTPAKKIKKPLKIFEQTMFDKLFEKSDSTKLSDHKYKFTQTLTKVKDQLYQVMKQEGYFTKRPDRVRQFYLSLGIIIIIISIPKIIIGVNSASGIAPGIGVLISGLLVIIFHRAMPQRTGKGSRQLLQVLGLRRTIKLGDYRQQLFEKYNYFEEILPFAIAFGLAHQWAKTVSKLNIKKPDWYQSSRVFTPITFTNSMTKVAKATSTTLPATYSSSAARGSSGFSSSGGFSGGGFGGGGGGSW